MQRSLKLLRGDAIPPVRRAPGRALAAALSLAGLAGCSTLAALDPTADRAGATAAVPAAAADPSDPLLAFAAGAPPGAASVVQGQPVRVARAYTAASGRECRELLIGGGVAERAALVCRDELLGWAHARPLLRGGGAARP